ncbi:hypothetical protein [Cohnella yongneupensis]|uniref:Uncharacterized protein n=1 Tax=Cohnella yongneupensis TaxID=425006 RepID=A0ABW0R5V2_9BACL
MSKRTIKIRYVILAFAILVIVTPFAWWKIAVHRQLDIVVVNKTFPTRVNASGQVEKLDYSKQRGLYWLLNEMGITNSETKKKYNVNRDYYGNFLENGRLVNKPLRRLTHVPDVIYLSDMYGTGNARVDSIVPPGVSGLTKEEVGIISSSYARGTTVIGEYNIAGDPTKPNVTKELEEIFGVRYSGMAGKFFSDLSSTADVPNWIRAIYEQQYGKKWSLTGAGIVIAGNNRIVVLQQGTGFNGTSIRISMTDANADKYNTHSVDYYNWFEIVQPVDQQSVIAWYDLDLTEEGAAQLKPFGLNGRFPAIIDNRASGKHAYYMAGDFTDYRGPNKIKQFIGATTVYRYFSIESEGDLSYFYWLFYVPFMTEVLKDVKPIDSSVQFDPELAVANDGTKLVSKAKDGKFSVYRNGSWNEWVVKGVNIGSSMPGDTSGALPDDPAMYGEWLEKIAAMHANTIRVYKLMPAEFYRALDNYNFSHPDRRLYLLQNIAPEQAPENGPYTDSDYAGAFERTIDHTIDAMHGNLETVLADGQSTAYWSDVSAYVLGYLIDPEWTPEAVAATDSSNAKATYAGEYVSTVANATRTEAWLAALADRVYRVEQTHYGMQHPTSIVSGPELERSYHELFDPVGTQTGATIDLKHLELGDRAMSGLFEAYNVFPDQRGFGFAPGDEGISASTFAGFKKYVNALLQAPNKYPILISEFGIPTINGLSEKVQGEGLASLISIINDSGAMGGLIYEWADEWGKTSAYTSAFANPADRASLWHNVVDPAQNYGIVSLESKQPEQFSMTLQGHAPLDSLALSVDESYLYLRAKFSAMPDLSRKDILLYLDTIDRKNGEYMLAPDVNENWSGAEFSVRVHDANAAELLVIPSYNTGKGSYYTRVSKAGIYEKMIKELTPAYVTRSGDRVNAVHEDASSLISGPYMDNGNSFNVEGDVLKVRIPWSRLNFTDPSSLLVINDEKSKGKIAPGNVVAVRLTDGIVASLVVMDQGTSHVDYHFPESINSPGYKTFAWNAWDVPQFEQRMKSSYDIIGNAYAAE